MRRAECDVVVLLLDVLKVYIDVNMQDTGELLAVPSGTSFERVHNAKDAPTRAVFGIDPSGHEVGVLTIHNLCVPVALEDGKLTRCGTDNPL